MLSKEDRDKVIEEIKEAIQKHNGPIAAETVESYARKLNQFIEDNSDSLLADDLKPSNPQVTSHLDAVNEHIATFSQILEALIEDSAKVDISAEVILQNKKTLEGLANSFNEVRNRVVEDKTVTENIAKIKLQIEDERKKAEKHEAEVLQNAIILKNLEQELASTQAKVEERESESKKIASEISQ